MHAPGVEVRPLKQMTGSEEFNEVFFSDVAIPDMMRLGPANGGWTVSTATLMNERGGLSGRPEVGRGTVDVVIDEARARGAWRDPLARDRLMALWCRERVLQMTALRGAVNLGAGKAPGPEGSIGKLAGSELNQQIAELRIDLMGAEASAFIAEEPIVEPSGRRELGMGDLPAKYLFCYSPAMTILGGTSNIHRNIIGERVLGLPREPDPYKGAPWSTIPR